MMLLCVVVCCLWVLIWALLCLLADRTIFSFFVSLFRSSFRPSVLPPFRPFVYRPFQHPHRRWYNHTTAVAIAFHRAPPRQADDAQPEDAAQPA
jgi:hypothetical protein